MTSCGSETGQSHKSCASLPWGLAVPIRSPFPCTTPRCPKISCVWTVAAGAGAIWATTPEDHALWRIDPNTNAVTRISLAYPPTGVTADANDVWVTVRRYATDESIRKWAPSRQGAHGQRANLWDTREGANRIRSPRSGVTLGTNWIWLSQADGGGCTQLVGNGSTIRFRIGLLRMGYVRHRMHYVGVFEGGDDRRMHRKRRWPIPELNGLRLASGRPVTQAVVGGA